MSRAQRRRVSSACPVNFNWRAASSALTAPSARVRKDSSLACRSALTAETPDTPPTSNPATVSVRKTTSGGAGVGLAVSEATATTEGGAGVGLAASAVTGAAGVGLAVSEATATTEGGAGVGLAASAVTGAAGVGLAVSEATATTEGGAGVGLAVSAATGAAGVGLASTSFSRAGRGVVAIPLVHHSCRRTVPQSRSSRATSSDGDQQRMRAEVQVDCHCFVDLTTVRSSVMQSPPASLQGASHESEPSVFGPATLSDTSATGHRARSGSLSLEL